MLGEYDLPPGFPFRVMSKGKPVNSHCPVQRDLAHSGVKVKSTFFLIARSCADFRSLAHG